MKLTEIQEILSDSIFIGDASDVVVDNFAPIEESNSRTVAWIRGTGEQSIAKISQGNAPIILAEKNFPTEHPEIRNRQFFLCDNPRLSYSRLVRFYIAHQQEWGIHPTAVIHPDAQVAENVSIGPYSIIGRAKIASGTVIHGHCFIHDNTEIGERVHLHAHTCIGSDGFSFEWNEDGGIEKLPHIGKCIIEADVEIYPFANVDRGTLGTVRVGRGTKLDHHVHVGHNCTVGENSIITASVVMCGGSHVRNNVWVGVQTTIKEKCIVGSHSFIGLNSLVTKDVPESEIWVGAPAKFLRKKN